MDIDEWEFLPDGGYLDFNEVGHENQMFFGNRNSVESKTSSVFDMNYFCTSPKSMRRTPTPSWNQHHHQYHQRVLPKQELLHVPIQLEPTIGKAEEGSVEERVEKTQKKTKGSNSGGGVGVGVVESVDQDTVSQVFFKIKENDQFVDMKLDSPRSSGSSRGLFFPPIDGGGGGSMRFEEKGEALENIVTSPRMKIEKEMTMMMDCDKELMDGVEGEKQEEEKDEEEEELEDSSSGDGFNFWKWGLSGVGAIFSFGVAAATVCVLFFGSQQRNKIQQEQRIRFQIYTDDKRLKQVVQHATKLNEAISAVRGVPLSRAHITYGGYYDGL